MDRALGVDRSPTRRWPHGDAPTRSSLLASHVPDCERAQVRGRARPGRIAIAHSDSGGGAHADVAIEQAPRGVTELPGARLAPHRPEEMT
jgi:hypothetical protein